MTALMQILPCANAKVVLQETGQKTDLVKDAAAGATISHVYVHMHVLTVSGINCAHHFGM